MYSPGTIDRQTSACEVMNKPRSLLVVDDEDDIREIAKMSLEITRGWHVSTAASGQEGIAIAIAHRFDAILLDVSMPHFDGVATLKKLHDHPQTRDIPVIFLTANVQTAYQYQYAQLGAKAVVIKPFDPGLLAHQIEEALSW